MGKEFVESLLLTSQLHDIGKIGIPDHILLKPGKLTTEEFKVMRRHCAIGVEILQQDYKGTEAYLALRGMSTPMGGGKMNRNRRGGNPFLEMASSISMTHHERWDGTGYPGGLSGDEIPVESRIVALADVFDALCSVRPYKPAYPESKSLTILRNEVGKHFDPVVHAAFEKSIEEVRSIRIQLQDEIPESLCGAKEGE